jgi:hypothetical protein
LWQGFFRLWAWAQEGGGAAFTAEPLCLTIKNDADTEALGHVETDQFLDKNGRVHWHKNTFKLPPGETQDFCGTGPFFNGNKLRVVVKAAVPLYTCKVAVPTTVTLTKIADPAFPGGITWIMDCVSERQEVSK